MNAVINVSVASGSSREVKAQDDVSERMVQKLRGKNEFTVLVTLKQEHLNSGVVLSIHHSEHRYHRLHHFIMRASGEAKQGDFFNSWVDLFYPTNASWTAWTVNVVWQVILHYSRTTFHLCLHLDIVSGYRLHFNTTWKWGHSVTCCQRSVQIHNNHN